MGKNRSYLYSEYASMSASWMTVATKKVVTLKQLIFGHPVNACGDETLEKNEKQNHHFHFYS